MIHSLYNKFKIAIFPKAPENHDPRGSEFLKQDFIHGFRLIWRHSRLKGIRTIWFVRNLFKAWLLLNLFPLGYSFADSPEALPNK